MESVPVALRIEIRHTYEQKDAGFAPERLSHLQSLGQDLLGRIQNDVLERMAPKTAEIGDEGLVAHQYDAHQGVGTVF